jgi:hypothetical protein
LFYNLDLSDPRVAVRFPGLQLTKLPLYYAIGNVHGAFCYRVRSDHTIEILRQPYPKRYRDQIMKQYPEPLPPKSVELVPVGYDPRDPADVYCYGGVLGIGMLTARQKATLRKKLERWHLTKIGCPLADSFEESDLTFDEMVGGCSLFTQGMPQEMCPYRACENHKARSPLPVLLLIEPEAEDSFFGHVGGGDRGQLIFQLCENCGTVLVTNPCT